MSTYRFWVIINIPTLTDATKKVTRVFRNNADDLAEAINEAKRECRDLFGFALSHYEVVEAGTREEFLG